MWSVRAAQRPSDADWQALLADQTEGEVEEALEVAREILDRSKRAIGAGAVVLDIPKRPVTKAQQSRRGRGAAVASASVISGHNQSAICQAVQAKLMP